MQEIILSVGIDIGTSTTQLIFSKLTIENLASSYTVPRITIVDKEVIYRSEIYFTPLLSQTEIDAEAVREIIAKEYNNAGIQPEMVQTGAVIITGETARKQNANQVLQMLSGFAGDFVVATAGPDLESVLSGRGTGTDKLSKEKRLTLANLDIGGGTSNISVFDKGNMAGVCCLDIGGRLIKIDKATKKITYIYAKTEQLAKQNGIKIAVGDVAEEDKIRAICRLMSSSLSVALGVQPKDIATDELYTNNGHGLPDDIKIDGVTFSGGVADSIYNPKCEQLYKYGDIGVILGQEIAKGNLLKKLKLFKGNETIRATVVGAGTHTTEISGSTISYARDKLPIKNVPILKVSQQEEQTADGIVNSIKTQLSLYRTEDSIEQVAVAMSGNGYKSFSDIQTLAKAIVEGTKQLLIDKKILIIVLEADIAKAVGNAINVILQNRHSVICIDGIKAMNGDYIDIGDAIADARVVPVVIKTLVFNL
ncbi:MAG: ethanolamine ammonia-lyase reactivating factor EutA [Oscillospiraceae bacterium]